MRLAYTHNRIYQFIELSRDSRRFSAAIWQNAGVRDQRLRPSRAGPHDRSLPRAPQGDPECGRVRQRDRADLRERLQRQALDHRVCRLSGGTLGPSVNFNPGLWRQMGDELRLTAAPQDDLQQSVRPSVGAETAREFSTFRHHGLRAPSLPGRPSPTITGHCL